MSLALNTKLGPYEIVAAIGAGGMGEVYRARDARLDRDVAIKVLPRHLSSSPELRQRLEREAKAISQLAHPHICTLYDIGHQDGTDYLVMELLEGETLAQRLTKGALPLEQVLRIGAEIASALDAAHRKAVVHRDLKPGNVILTKTGAKLLDFGLAKSTALLDSDPSAVTISQPLTSKGMIVGTFQYMSPEQLEGKEADTRTDIFALGAVLYEMATGKRAFDGSSRASLIVSIMASHPRPISEIQPTSPPALDRLIRKCIAKDPDQRWQSAADIADELRWVAEGGSQASVSDVVHSVHRARARFWKSCAILFLVAKASLVLFYFFVIRGGHDARVVWSSISIPDGATLVPSGDLGGPVAMSPDGSAMAFTASSGGQQRLWVRALDSATARLLPGTEGAMWPFWSGDSRSIGFFAKEKLYTISAAGGPALSLCAAAGGRGGTWNRDGVILFAPEFQSGLFRVPANGGTPQPVTTVDVTKHTSHRWPTFCPDGEHFLYLAIVHGAAQTETNAVYLGSLRDGESKLVMRGGANAMLASDHLLYTRENTLLASRFDLNNARLLGEPSIIASEVGYDVSIWRSAFSVSNNGILAFHVGNSGGAIQMQRFDRNGKELGPIGTPDNFGGASISPDGKRVMASITGVETDLWVYDVARGAKSRITFESGSNLSPVWSPDGRDIIYANLRFAVPDAPRKLCRRPSTGGDVEVLLSSPDEVWPSSWSRDGKYLFFSKGKYVGGTPCDIWVLPLSGEREASPFLNQPFVEEGAELSPDGAWVAYASERSGRKEVYVAPSNLSTGDAPPGGTPKRGGHWQVSIQGGIAPKWSPDGRELFYLANNGKITSVKISTSADGVSVEEATELFSANVPSAVDPFDLSRDGEWFVVLTNVGYSTAPITLVTNWPAIAKNP